MYVIRNIAIAIKLSTSLSPLDVGVKKHPDNHSHGYRDWASAVDVRLPACGSPPPHEECSWFRRRFSGSLPPEHTNRCWAPLADVDATSGQWGILISFPPDPMGGLLGVGFVDSIRDLFEIIELLSDLPCPAELVERLDLLDRGTVIGAEV